MFSESALLSLQCSLAERTYASEYGMATLCEYINHSRDPRLHVVSMCGSILGRVHFGSFGDACLGFRVSNLDKNQYLDQNQCSDKNQYFDKNQCVDKNSSLTC